MNGNNINNKNMASTDAEALVSTQIDQLRVNMYGV